MLRDENKSLGVQLPISDIFLMILYFLIYPLIVGFLTLLFSVLINEETLLFLLLNFLSAFLFLVSFLFYYNSSRRLKALVLEVGFYHFQPSWREIAIHLIQQVYYVIGLGFLVSIILRIFSVETLELWYLFGISLSLSLVVQTIFLIRSIKSKHELLSTAQEVVDHHILEHLKNNYAKSKLISEYRFADIQLPSLFLSAGVMSFGWKKNVCLISRYFQWKLTDEELIAVFLHEIGHIDNDHIRKSYFLGGTEAFLRTLRVFCITIGVVLISNGQTIFTLNYLFMFSYLLLILLVFLSSTFLTLFFRYRIFLAEIRADSFCASAIGNTLLADTLRKLPSTIPSPIGYNQSSFLGLRVAILRHQAKIEENLSS